mmetsp:Transcript_112110/g.316838  ORF Transcript_112110/g.316838 Transcript_112110/m.316838 type:complete len:284 (+) Transcript_112110:196-1047(+)
MEQRTRDRQVLAVEVPRHGPDDPVIDHGPRPRDQPEALPGRSPQVQDRQARAHSARVGGAVPGVARGNATRRVRSRRRAVRWLAEDVCERASKRQWPPLRGDAAARLRGREAPARRFGRRVHRRRKLRTDRQGFEGSPGLQRGARVHRPQDRERRNVPGGLRQVHEASPRHGLDGVRKPARHGQVWPWRDQDGAGIWAVDRRLRQLLEAGLSGPLQRERDEARRVPRDRESGEKQAAVQSEARRPRHATHRQKHQTDREKPRVLEGLRRNHDPQRRRRCRGAL